VNTFDEIRSGQTEAEPPMPFQTFSGCPRCHKTSDILQVGHQLVELCVEHRLYWFGPLNPWSEPSADFEASQREKWAMLGLENFQKVQPWYLGQTAAA
jgi:hypothetical protein